MKNKNNVRRSSDKRKVQAECDETAEVTIRPRDDDGGESMKPGPILA